MGNDNGRGVAETATTTRTDNVRRLVDEAAITTAAAKAYEAGASSNRLSLDEAQQALVQSYARIDQLSDRLLKAHEQLAELQSELAQERNKDRKTRKQEKQIELKRAKAKYQGEVLQTLIKTSGPILPQLAPRLMLLTDRFLPSVIDVPTEGDKSPRAAVARLLKKIYDPNPEEAGPEVLQCLQDLAGPEDWMLCQMAFMQFAREPEDTVANAAPASSSRASSPPQDAAPTPAPAPSSPPPPPEAPSPASRPASAPASTRPAPAAAEPRVIFDAEYEVLEPELVDGEDGDEDDEP